MRTFLAVLSFIFLMIVGTSAWASKAESPYSFHFNLPQSKQWRLIEEEINESGYEKLYIPITSKNLDEHLKISYESGINTLPQTVFEKKLKLSPCEHKDSKIIYSNKNSFLATTTLSECNPSGLFMQIVRIINKPDGQYSIVYLTDQNTRPAAFQQIQKIIAQAELVANN